MVSRDDDLIDTIVFYTGVVLAIVGIAGAGLAVVEGMLFK